MLDAVPLGNEVIPPAKTTMQWKDGFHARQRVASVLLAHAKVHCFFLCVGVHTRI